MCGITAIIKFGISLHDDAIIRMTERLRHRGPDANSSIRLPDCHLGNARLKIIDMVTGDQPMSDTEKRYWITYNGEIYNYRQLRDDLLERGHIFKTASDTEVIILAYKEWGGGVPGALPGDVQLCDLGQPGEADICRERSSG
jgi:asparagine synthase (glutamine-hydrolysing)